MPRGSIWQRETAVLHCLPVPPWAQAPLAVFLPATILAQPLLHIPARQGMGLTCVGSSPYGSHQLGSAGVGPHARARAHWGPAP